MTNHKCSSIIDRSVRRIAFARGVAAVLAIGRDCVESSYEKWAWRASSIEVLAHLTAAGLDACSLRGAGRGTADKWCIGRRAVTLASGPSPGRIRNSFDIEPVRAIHLHA
ncbi:hypothetical protein [Bradyrhizobium sp. HKCCYLS20291]|uniref:hypothetical protein n=1 Tax=Bradyrhizobium sp. HKCCYLS20291 TaxID=3420766 RepID=UPI003EB9C1CE